MSNVYAFGVVTAEREEVIRQDIVDVLKRCLDGAGEMGRFPFFLSEAINGRIWEHPRRLPGGTPVKPMSLHEFITTRYPLGLGIDHDTVKKLIAGDPVVMDLYDSEVKRGDGNPHLGGQPRNEDGTFGAKDRTVDNIHGSVSDTPERPTGTSAQAGLRRLRKAADEGDARARQQLNNVMSGEMSVHAACVELGWRKKTVTLQDEPVVLFNAAVAKAGPLETAMRAWRMMSQEDKAQLLDWQTNNS